MQLVKLSIIDFHAKHAMFFVMDNGCVTKGKLTIDEIIENIKSKGITFNHITEESARNYLLEHTYYFKLKAYAKNYKKILFAIDTSSLTFPICRILPNLICTLENLSLR